MRAYVITNKVSGKKYVGITRQSLAMRWKWHVSTAKRNDKYAICRAIRKYGADSFTIEEIVDGLDWDDLCETEKTLIFALNTRAPNGYNLTDGGQGGKGVRHSAEAKLKISVAGKGRKLTEETKAKISAGHKGKTLSKEHRKKLSAAKLGKKQSARSKEHSEKISEGLRRAWERRRSNING